MTYGAVMTCPSCARQFIFSVQVEKDRLCPICMKELVDVPVSKRS